MYYEDVNRTFNIWRDADIIHVFVSVPEKKYFQYALTIRYVKKILGLNFSHEFDGVQIYFQLSDFTELNEFKTYFYRYLSKFEGEKINEN